MKYMLKNDEAIKQRLDEFYNGTEKFTVLPQNSITKYALFSDLHMGDGNKKADSFVHNVDIMNSALKYYKSNDYSLIFLGDVEDLWIFDLDIIKARYDKKIYSLIRSFGDEKVYRILGNHDSEWKFSSDPLLNNGEMIHKSQEAIKLGNDIFLLHGHQGDYKCDQQAFFSKSFVHYFGRDFNIIGRTFFNYENRSATKSQIPKNREKLYYDWARSKKVILICGHTHNAIFASQSYYWWLKEQIEVKKEELEKIKNTEDKVRINRVFKEIIQLEPKLLDERKKDRKYNRITAKEKEPLPCYFNTGCGLFKKGITNIEIEGDIIRLIKWEKNKRKELWKKSLSEIRKKINA